MDLTMDSEPLDDHFFSTLRLYLPIGPVYIYINDTPLLFAFPFSKATHSTTRLLVPGDKGKAS